MRIIGSGIVLLSALLLVAGTALADDKSATQQGKKVEKESKSATKQPTSEGAKSQSGKGFDTPSTAPGAVKAESGKKESPVGQKTEGYKPKPKPSKPLDDPKNAPPSPTTKK